jgi:hypothetical protein
MPVIGLRVAEVPADWVPVDAQGDQITRVKTGLTYDVKEGRPDSHGHVKLMLNLA